VLRFDDRLKTVLAQPASDRHDRAVRWRQLVEIVARAGDGGDPDLLARALDEIERESGNIDQRTRTAAALSVASVQLPANLVSVFASDRLAVAAPVLASARLSAAEWAEVAQSASEECRGFIAQIRSQAPARMQEDRRTAPGRPPPQSHEPTIGDVVAKIERLRQSRETGPRPSADGASKSVSSPGVFRWECNEAGEIEWVDGAPRGALIGQSIAQSGSPEGVDRSVERAFAARAPFHGGTLVLARGGTTQGRWEMSGVPAFEPSSGRFAGYRGIAQRSDRSARASGGEAPDSGSIRELAHEVRTPLNAIIGFAEMICGEYLGPASESYRKRASEILDQAGLLLAAVEDLDLAATLKAHRSQSDLSDALANVWSSITEAAKLRGVTLTVQADPAESICALAPQLTERLLERLSLAVVGGASPGETLELRIEPEGKYYSVKIPLSGSLENIDLRPERNRRSGDTRTLALRLVMGLARTAGGDLEAGGGFLALRLPKA